MSPKDPTKMKYQYKGYHPPSKMSSPYMEIGDINPKHINMDEFKRRTNDEETRTCVATTLVISRLVEEIYFSMIVQSSEFVLTCTHYYNHRIKKIMRSIGEVVLDVSSDMNEKVFKIPYSPQYE